MPVALLALIALSSDLKLHEGVKGKWDALLDLPVVRKTSGGLSAFAQKDFWAAERAIYDRFVKNTKQDFIDLKGESGLAAWSYEGGGEVRLNTGRVVSIQAGAYSYMGGAHGMGVCRTYNYGFVNGKAKRLSIWDVVRKDARANLRLILLGLATKEEGTDWIQDGTVNDFTEDQLNRFWIDKDALVFEFNQYELGSYAAGPFTFRVAFADLKPSLKPNNPLKSLIR